MPRIPSRRSSACREHVATAVLFVAGLAWVGGCDGAAKLEFREKFKHYTREQNYEIALKSEDADARRRAVVRLAKDAPGGGDETFHVLDAVARTDANAQVRCASIRGLQKYEDDRPVATLLAILNPQGHPNESGAAATPVRWDAANALVQCCERGAVPDDRVQETLDVLVELLLHDTSREVQMAAARGLGTIADVRAVRALIGGLRHQDFGIAYESQMSLQKLTGQGHAFDADAWEAWLAATRDPFGPPPGEAASKPASTQPAG